MKMEEVFVKSRRFLRVDIDGDGEEEVVSIKFQKLRVMKGESVLFEKVVPGVFLSVAVGDVDGDGSLEIVAGSSDKYIRVFGVDGSIKREIRFVEKEDKFGGWVWNVRLIDVDSDGKMEILASGLGARGGRGGDLVLFKGDGSVLWRLTLKGTPFGLAVDGDYVFAGTSWGYLYKVSLDGKIIREVEFGAPINDLLVYNGKVIIASSFGDIAELDSELHVVWKKKITNYYKPIAYSLAVHDVDNDGQLEIIVSGRRVIRVYRENGEQIFGRDLNEIKLDIDDDGELETMRLGIFGIIIEKGKQKKELFLEDLPECACLADINLDGKLEIGAALANGKVVFMDLDGREIRSFSMEVPSLTVNLADVDNDGDVEAIVGGSMGVLVVYSIRTGEVKYRTELGGDISAIATADIDGDGHLETIVATTPQASEIRILRFHS